jgi:uroporphyrinogen III methyltransferase/synthase
LGKVTLVGAGPGAPDLVTVRGLAAVRRADAVVFDSLAPAALLDEAPAEARRIDVGKRGHDAPTRSQEEINALLIGLAREGLEVVRLKGGDPFVFGRGGEEATACADAGIPFEVVPGVSSPLGVLAYAGIPLTDRRHAASFAVVTGHKDPSKPREEIRWAGLARSADTLVVLMGMRNLEEIVARILAGGRAPDTPAAIVMNGTTPAQRVVEAPLSELPRRAREQGMAAPAAIVVGDVVRLRERMAWFEKLPLFGRRVLVTRPESQSGGRLEALRAAGAEALVVPVIRIVALAHPAALDAALARLDAYDALLFTSANGVVHFVRRAREHGVALEGLRAPAWCVGPATARAAFEAGLPVHRVPERFDAGGLLATIVRVSPPEGRRFLLPRAAKARDTLPVGLRAAGAAVDAVPAYETLAGEFDAAALGESLAEGAFDAVTFASPSAVRFLVDALDPAGRVGLQRCAVAAIGPVTAEALREAGLTPALVAERATGEDLVTALVAHLAVNAGDTQPAGGSR